MDLSGNSYDTFVGSIPFWQKAIVISRNNDSFYLSSCSPSKDTSIKLLFKESIVFCSSETIVLLTTAMTESI